MTNDSIWTESAVEKFADLDPTDEEIDSVENAIRDLAAGRDTVLSIGIPAISKEFENLHLAMTRDRTWRIVFKLDSDRLTVLSVDRNR